MPQNYQRKRTARRQQQRREQQQPPRPSTPAQPDRPALEPRQVFLSETNEWCWAIPVWVAVPEGEHPTDVACALDRAIFARNPDLQLFVRPLIKDEFGLPEGQLDPEFNVTLVRKLSLYSRTRRPKVMSFYRHGEG